MSARSPPSLHHRTPRASTSLDLEHTAGAAEQQGASPDARQQAAAAPGAAAAAAGATPASADPSKPLPAFRRLSSKLSAAAWGSDGSLTSRLLRHSSLNNVVPTARWPAACFMLVCADGAPYLLGLPAAMARLGWPAGIAALLVGLLCILHSATCLVGLHEHGGRRHNRYRDLAQAVWGKERGTWLVLPFQLTVNCGTCCIYLVTAGQALQALCATATGGSAGGGCPILTAWTLIFSACLLLFCVLPDMSSLSAVTLLGAGTTVAYSALATAGAALHGPAPGPSPYAVPGSPADRAFGAFGALGAVYLLFGLTVLLDIQATLAPLGSPPSAVPPMLKATVLGYLLLAALFLAVALSGFWAFGAAVQPIVLQSMGGPAWLLCAAYLSMVVNAVPGYLVFAHSVFDLVDLRLTLSHWSGVKLRGGRALLAKKLCFRWAFVAATAGLAVCLPFLPELMGLVGAIGYVPLCFILPCAMWLKTQQLSAARAAVSWAVIAISGCVAVLAAVGSVRSLAVSVSSYRFFT